MLVVALVAWPQRDVVAKASSIPAGVPWDPAQGYMFAGKRQAHERELDVLLAAANKFWDQRNVPAAPVGLYVADRLAPSEMGDAPAVGWGSQAHDQAGAQVVLDSAWAGTRLAALRSQRPRSQVRAVRKLLGLMTHEVGHARGLEHTQDGLMAPSMFTVPGDWRTVARELGVTRFPGPRRVRGSGKSGVG